MSAIDRQTVAAAARLSRLAVSDQELTDLQAHFERLLEFVADVTDADIEDVEPMAHPLDLSQRLRSDAVTAEVDRDALQAGAPRVQDGYYLVPRVIE